jgi:hypothetical protein
MEICVTVLSGKEIGKDRICVILLTVLETRIAEVCERLSVTWIGVRQSAWHVSHISA